MENNVITIIVDIIKISSPVFMWLVGWYIWSLKQKFASKQEFIKYTESQGQVLKILENKINEQETKINKQSEDMREIKADIRHIAEAIKDIKDYLFKRRG